MANRRCSRRYVILDLDETLVEGTIASRVIKEVLKPKNGHILPRKYYLKALRYIHLPLLSKLRRFYRIYRYLLHRTFSLYVSVLNDPKVNREAFLEKVKEVARHYPIPEVSRTFVKKLKEKGYTTVLLTAAPQEIADVVKERLDLDEAIGSIPGRVLDRETKEKVLLDLSKRGCIDIIVGNPGNEPFWLAERYAIIVRSPKDLRRWLDKI